jgi:hypothetical protein
MRLMTPTGRLASVGACPAPTTSSCKFARAARRPRRQVTPGLPRGVVLRALLTNRGFTISVFVAVAITVMFGYVFDASQPLVATLLVLGILTAVAEYALGSDGRQNIDSTRIGKRESPH